MLSFLLTLHGVNHAEVYLHTLVATCITKMVHHSRVTQKCFGTRLDRMRGHYHDKLVHTIALMQLVHRVRIYVGLTRASLHLHIEVQCLLGTIAERYFLILVTVGILLLLGIADILDELLAVGYIIEYRILVQPALTIPYRHALKNIGNTLNGQLLMLQS